MIPYYPLGDQVMGEIIRLQLGRISKRVAQNYKIPFTFEDNVVDLIASRCTELESGGRMIDAILTNTMLPAISDEFLTRLAKGEEIQRVHISAPDGEFNYSFDEK